MDLEDLLPFLKKSIRSVEFERSVFAVVARHVADKRALGEELAGVENLQLIPVSDNERRQKAAAALYLLLERNIAEEQVRNRIPREKLREEILNHCHPERADGNFAVLFLPHYERQVKLFEKFTDGVLAKARDIMGLEAYEAFMKSLEADPALQGVTKNGAVNWRRVKNQVKELTPAVQRDTIQAFLERMFRTLATRLTGSIGEIRTELIFEETYRRFSDALDFVDDVAKALLLVPDAFLAEERVALMGKPELEKQLRQKSKELETTLAEVQSEKLKLSEMTREELEREVEKRTAELLNALKAAQEARKNLEEFSSLATHELRTPIAAMKGYLNLASDERSSPSTAETRKYIAHAIRANERLLTLVNAMLDVSRIELGTLAIDPVPTAVAEAADGVLAELVLRIREKGQNIVKSYDPAVPMLDLDPSLMHAIFVNLISNAVKYTPEKGTITVMTEKRDADILITVADTGFGIPKAQQARIFEKMFRADNARTSVPEGTGLGLYLVKSILDQTGGKIWFESEENKGTTFFATIPLSGMKRREGAKGLS